MVRHEDRHVHRAGKVYAVVQGIWQLPVGKGVLPVGVKSEESTFALIRHYTNVLTTTENILDVADWENVLTGFSVRLLELAFATPPDGSLRQRPRRISPIG